MFTRLAMIRLLCLVAFLPQLPGVLCAVMAVGDPIVLAGKSITVPCRYDPEYTANVKYWCQGSVQSFCTSLARTDEPGAGPSSDARIIIADDPTQQVFAVTMRDMTESESGWYWCGVEIGGIWSKDISTAVYIDVREGISVENKEVSAEEGGSVTIRCHYSLKHRETEKKWCRSGNVDSCAATSAGTFVGPSLLIGDDRKDTVTVTMRQLAMRDAGWYYCGAGEHQESVRVLVTPRSTTRPTTTIRAHLSAAALDVKRQTNQTEGFVEVQGFTGYISQCLLIACGALFFIMVAIFGTSALMRQNKSTTKYKSVILV